VNNTVEKMSFRISQGKVIQYTGEVGKCIRYWYQIFWGFIAPKLIKIG